MLQITAEKWQSMDHQTIHKLEKSSGEDAIMLKSDIHIQSCAAELAAATSLREGTRFRT